MEESTRARAGVCPTHGVVTPTVAGGRWKCPVCGTFIRKQGSTILAASPRAPERSTDEMLWRLEIHHVLQAIAAKLSDLPGHVQTLVEFGAAMDWIEWADAGRMTLPATDLEIAVGRIVDRAAKLAGAQQLVRTLSNLEEECMRRSEEKDRLRTEGAALKEAVAHQSAESKRLGDWLKAVERKTGMSTPEEILRHLQHFSAVSREVERLSRDQDQLNRDCGSAFYQLAHLRGEIGRGQREVARLSELEGGSWDRLADKLSREDVMNLFDRRRENQLKARLDQLEQRQANDLRALERRAISRISPGHPDVSNKV